MRVRAFNTLAAIFWKLRLPTKYWLWCAHPKAWGKIHVRRGSLLIARNLEVSGRVTIAGGTRILTDDLKLGREVSIGTSVTIHAKKIELGDGVQIDEGVKCEGGEFPQSSLILDEGVWIFPFCILNTTFGLRIGAGTGIGGYSMIWTHGSWQPSLEGYPVKYAPTAIGKNVWLPWHVIVMPGITIGDNVTLGAGSLVMKDIENNALAAGVPAKVMKSGLASWPPQMSPAEIEKVFQDLLAGFNEWQKSSFQWKELTILASRNHHSEPLSARFFPTEAKAVLDTAIDSKVFYVVTSKRQLNGRESDVSYFSINERRFHVRTDRPQHRDFVRYLSHHGLHALDENTRLPNHRA